MFGGFINPPLGGSIRGVQGGTAPFCRKVKKVKYGYDFFKNSKKS